MTLVHLILGEREALRKNLKKIRHRSERASHMSPLSRQSIREGQGLWPLNP